MSFDLPEFQLSEKCTIKSSTRIFKKEYVETGVPFMRSKDVIDKALGVFSYFELFISKERYQEIKNKYGSPKKGDLLISSVGNRSGWPYIVQDEGDFYFKDGNVIWMSKFDGLDPDFLAYWLKSDIGQSALASIMIGSAQKAITIDSLRKLWVNFPSFDYQQRSSTVLKLLDKKIAGNKATNQTLEQMAQAIFKSWFVDFDPVKAKMNGEQPEGMDAATASLFPEKLVESELGLIPEGWEAKPLGDYLTIKRGGSPRPIKEFIVPNGYPWTKIADATANDNPYIFKTKEFIKEEGLKKTVYLKKGTLILSNSATPGLPRFLDLDACIHDGWLHFPEKKHFTDYYLYQLFLHIRKHLVSQGNGSVFTNLKTDILRNQMVLVPPKELVDIYEKHAGKFLETVKAKSIESNQLAQLRDTLLPKLLSGEIELASMACE